MYMEWKPYVSVAKRRADALKQATTAKKRVAFPRTCTLNTSCSRALGGWSGWPGSLGCAAP